MSGEQPYVSPWIAGLTCRCPRCGKGKLFAGFLKVAPKCSACGLDFTAADSADGPAVFIVLIAGAIVTFGALWVELSFRPPYWVHIAIWPPLILALCLGMLRPFKATMIALQFYHRAGEGRTES